MKNRRSFTKFDLKGVRFKTWILFLSFSGGILFLLWILQVSSLNPYYRSVKVNNVQTIADYIESSINNDENMQDVIDITYDNGVCLAIYNYQEYELLNVNALGVGCYLSNTGYGEKLSIGHYISLIDDNDENEVYEYVRSERFQDEMLIYGKKIDTNLGSYYLLLNAMVEPVDSTVFIMQNQFLIILVCVLLVSGWIAFIMANAYANPITKMTDSAILLAEGDYDVRFNGGSYTEIDELANTLNYVTEELSKTEELRRDLIANVSHDIKTPLTTIKAYAEMINDISGDNPIKRRQHVDVIINEANHMNKLVDDMLVLTKIQSGNMIINEIEFDIVNKAKEISNVLRGLQATYNVKIIFDTVDKAYIKADETLIGQVIYNFLNNAIKHVGDDKQVVITITKIADKFKIAITDHGTGIASENLPYIWDRYYKIDKNYQRNQEGSGLGLAISKAYLDLHDCEYGVESELNVKTTFWFII
ncbi:MAG: HAMP domain-containing sensor histidine kinase [Erysipelotrichaceae bacterium]|nr:HAMP domain-containing sensor histidine kinase [Erysipelotrichaceae bacterium]MDD3923660.1 HAMP domain-containing sensor histidine kinase [Erysipelotrichaceae bacterium]MDD4642179.1 HAMP domain-containing sensor histidine kinase [Erysipelotrichaceae bacterium]